MEDLTSIGILFAGMGILFSSFALLWFVSLYKQSNAFKDDD